MLGQVTGDHGLTWLTTAWTQGKPPPSPILYYLRYSTAPTSEWHFFPGLPSRSLEIVSIWTPRTLGIHNSLLRPPIGMRFETCSSPWELSNGVLHSTCTHRGWVDSRLLMVESQTASLTPDLSFIYNLCCRYSNGSCKAIFDICTSRPFQRYKEHVKARCFGPWNRTVKFWKSWRTLKSPFWECECHPHTLSKWGCDKCPSFSKPC
jgi:hypothetical protein